MKCSDKFVTVNVTKNDIKRGVKADCSRCPIALAMRRILKAGTVISVIPEQVGLKRRERYFNHFSLPDMARRFAEAFDTSPSRRYAHHHANPHPVTFLVRIPRRYLRRP